MSEKLVTFTLAEAEALYDLLDTLSGGNAGSVFAWDGSDDPEDETISAAAKLFKALDREVPENLEEPTHAP